MCSNQGHESALQESDLPGTSHVHNAPGQGRRCAHVVCHCDPEDTIRIRMKSVITRFKDRKKADEHAAREFHCQTKNVDDGVPLLPLHRAKRHFEITPEHATPP